MSYPAPATTGPLDVAPQPTTARPERSGTHPAVRLLGFFAVAYVTMSAACIGLGLLVTDASALAGIRRWDVSVNRWFVHQRTDLLDGFTAVGSHLAETPVVIGVGLFVVGLLWWRRRDVEAIGILVVGLTLEVSVFVTTTLFVDRSRPPVHHLDAAPPTSSFPSGHTAAAIVLYVGLIVVVYRVWRRGATSLALSVALALVPVAVGLSRLYRGMHQPSDVVVGAILGVTALVIASAAVRTTVARPNPPARRIDRVEGRT